MTFLRPSSIMLSALVLPAALAAACSSSVQETNPSTGGAAADCPQAATMLDVSKAPGAGDGYPKPSVSAHCTDTTFVVESNVIPPYTFVQTTPNPLTAQSDTYEIPRDPQVAAQTTEVPLLGLAGFAVNGLPFFGPNEGATPADSAYGDPVYNGLMDPCYGHTAFEYHYHSMSVKCLDQQSLVAKPWMNDDPPADAPSPVIGWALDGFPIYGPQECADTACSSVVVMQSGYVKTGDPTTYAWKAYQWQDSADPTRLDACNGHTGPKGDYHYHATSGFPYIIGCYKGTPMGAGGMTGGGTGPKSCASAADCDGACPQGSIGCTCASSPMGMVCTPTCSTSADCPMGPMGQLSCSMGVCSP